MAVNHVWEQRGFHLPRPVAWLLTSLFVMGCFVLFRSPDFATAGQVWSALARAHGVESVSMDTDPFRAMVLGALVAVAGPTSQTFAMTRLRPQAGSRYRPVSDCFMCCC